MYRTFVGVDPGKGGGIAIITVTETGLELKTLNMPETSKDIIDVLSSVSGPQSIAILELVHSRPNDGSRQAFTFGQMYGRLETALVAAGLRHDYVSPQKWMKSYQMVKKGDEQTVWKNKLKAKAQSIFPTAHITLKTADAVLIAYYNYLINK